jgi:hypothetical protein
MRVKSISLLGMLTIVAALTLSGCKKSEPAPPPPAQSSSVAEPAAAPATPAATPGTASSAATPAPGAVAPETPATAPAAVAASAPPPPPAVVQLTAPAGARVVVSITERLSASHNDVGDRFTGVLAEPVRTSGGAAVFARGTRVLGTVIASKGRGKFKGSGALGIQLSSIGGTRVSSSSYEKEVAGKGKRSAGFIGGGAGGGALIGGLAGGGKGALIGGLLGGGAGTAGAAFTGNKDVVIPSESVVTFRLTAPLTVTR